VQTIIASASGKTGAAWLIEEGSAYESLFLSGREFCLDQGPGPVGGEHAAFSEDTAGEIPVRE
jgi:hypothetical protein